MDDGGGTGNFGGLSAAVALPISKAMKARLRRQSWTVFIRASLPFLRDRKLYRDYYPGRGPSDTKKSPTGHRTQSGLRTGYSGRALILDLSRLLTVSKLLNQIASAMGM